MARPFSLTTIRPFKGLNSFSARASLAPDELSNLQNMGVAPGGYLEKRKGIYRLVSYRPAPAGNLRLMLISRGIAPVGDQFWFASGGKIYRTSAPFPSVWSTIQWAGVDLITAPQWFLERKVGADYYAVAVARTDNPPFFIKYDGTVIAAAGGPTGTMCADYKGRMWVINSLGTAGTESDLDFSAVEDWQTWYPSTSAGKIAINPGDGQFCVALQVYNDNLYIFKDRSIWVLNAEGDPTSFTPRLVHATLGCIGRGTVQLIDGFMYFMSGEGVYRTDGTTFEELSQPIRNEFWNQDYTSQALSLSRDAVVYDNKYILTTEGYAIYVYDTVSESWSRWTPPTNVPFRLNGLANYPESGTEKFYAGSDAGYLMAHGADWYRDDTEGTAGGTADNDVVGYATTADFTEELPVEYKRNHYVAFDLEGTQNVTQIRYQTVKDGGLTGTKVTKTLTAASNSRTQMRFSGAGRFRTMAVNLEALGNAKARIFGFSLANEVRNPVSRGN